MSEHKILVVDDEPVLRSLIQEALVLEGFFVETADRAGTALGTASGEPLRSGDR